MRFALLSALLFLLITGFQFVSAQQIPTRLFSAGDGASEMRGGLLFKNCENYLFHGNKNIVRRFDGNTWKIYAELPENTDVTAFGIHQDRLWLGTASGQIWREHGKGFILFEPEEGQIQAAISKILSVNGNVWIASLGDGLYCWSKNRLFRFDDTDGMPDLSVTDLQFFKDKIWAGTDQGLVSIRFESEKKHIKRHPTDDLLIGSLSSDSSQLWLAFQAGGIREFASASGISVGNGLGLLKIQSKHGNIWVLDEAGNIWIKERTAEKLVHLPFSFNNKTLRIDDFVFDDNGFLWLSSQYGVVSSQIGFRLYSFLTNIQVQSVLQITSEQMWLGSTNGLYKWNIVSHQLEMLDGSAGLNVLSLHLDQLNRLWVGTYGQGLYCLTEGKLIKIGAAHGLNNANVFSMAASKDLSVLYLGTLGGLYTVHLNAKEPAKWVTAFKQSDPTGPGSYYIYQVFVDSKDRLWVGTDGMGAFLHASNRFEQFNQSSTGEFRIVTSITEDQNGTIWLGSLDKGLLHITGKTITAIDLHAAPPKLEITAITTYKNQLLISSTDGLSAMDLGQKKAIDINKLYGFQATEGITNAIFTNKNKVWIGVKEGVVSIDLDVLNIHKAPALAVQLNDPNPGADSIFQPNQNALSFYLNSIWGGAPDAIFMRYKLVGFHKEWVSTEKKEIFLQGLRPGNYQLLVESSLYPDFSLAQSSSYGFRIKKPFYARWWFALILLISAGLLTRVYSNAKKRKRKNEENAKVEQIRAQYELLKSQVSPHFLFNSFNTLLALIEEDQKLASTYVEKLSVLFRSVLTYKDTDLISLKEELILVEAYIYLQKQRFGANLSININIPADTLKQMVMPMSLQLLVENAIKHNTISTQKPLQIDISSTRKHVVVRNNLQPKAQSEPSTGFGLSSLELRYSSLFKENLIISTNDHHFQVNLPLITAL
jgi:ligand-binding sensor domain-containing protein